MRHYFPLIFFLLVVCPLTADQKICLNMIVKNESKVIEKCLASAKPLIDYWVIVDTGSTDGTQEIIRSFLKDIPGELHERPWVNFSHNRNQALDLARDKGDYILFIDADEYFQYAPSFKFPSLDLECYYIILREISEGRCVDSYRASLIDASLPWRWGGGVIHEYLQYDGLSKTGIIEGLVDIVDPKAPSGRCEYSCDNKKKYMKDALLLEEELAKEPSNSRYRFYLAQSYALAGCEELAAENYEKRASIEENAPERFAALYLAGKLRERLKEYDKACHNFLTSFQWRPYRAEPLTRLAAVYRKMGQTEVAYILSKQACMIPLPKGENWLEPACYSYEAQEEFANNALLTGRWREGLAVCERLLQNPELPQDHRLLVLKNKDLALQHLSH